MHSADSKITLLPCPFCASSNIDAEGWASTSRRGPACDDCGASADTVELWNSRPDPNKHFDKRMQLGIKDMPNYRGNLQPLTAPDPKGQ